MSARVEITKKYATAHRKAVKKDKGHIQDTPSTVGPNGVVNLTRTRKLINSNNKLTQQG